MNIYALLPERIRQKVLNSQEIKRILDNIGWLFFDKIFRMGVGLFVGVWMARYLGADQFGKISYATAFVAIFGSITGLGLNGIVVRNIVRDPESSLSVLGTAFVMMLISGSVSFVLINGAKNFLGGDDDILKLAVFVISLTQLIKAVDVVKYWFESQVRSRYVVMIENLVFFAGSSARVFLIISDRPMIYFVWLIVFEVLLSAVGLLVIYNNTQTGLRNWRPEVNRAKSLLNDSWPLVLAGMAVMVYMKIDQIMIGEMLGSKDVGLYSAASKISEIWYFIPMTIAASVSPAIIKAKSISVDKYRKTVQQLMDFMSVISIFIALIFSFLSSYIVRILFGGGYAESASVLAIHIWTGVFVFLGVASSQWFLAENLQRLSFYRTLAGAFSNVILNLLLIPEFGILGAAWATLISQAVASVFFNVIGGASREVFYMQIKAMFFVNAYRYFFRNKA